MEDQMKIRLAWTFVFLMLVALCACDRGERYGVEQGKDGRVYRIDKKTGEMAVVSGEKVISLNTPEMRKDEGTLAEAKFWGQTTIPPPHSLQLSLASSWREGLMHYRLKVTPYSQGEKLQKGNNSIDIVMTDKGGFHLLTIPVLLNRLSFISDEKGEKVGFEMSSSVECSAEKYKAFTGWTPMWRLEEIK
jgi:hypothetical protein